MTIFNTFSRGTAVKNRIAGPVITNFSFVSSNTSSLTVNLSAVDRLYGGATYKLTASIPQSSSNPGCHAILKTAGYSFTDPSATSYTISGSPAPTNSQTTFTGLYYDSDYLITLTVTNTSGGTDYYTLLASTAAPDDIIITGNNASGSTGGTTYTNLTYPNFPIIVVPRKVSYLSPFLVGGGGSANNYGGGGGGGAGGYAFVSLSPGTLLNWQVGGGASTNPSKAGGDTYLTTLNDPNWLYSGGGSGGVSGNGFTAGGGGGAGGYNLGGNGGSVSSGVYAGGSGGGSGGTVRSTGGGASGGTGGSGTSVNAITGAATNNGGAAAGGSGGSTGRGGGGIGLYGQSGVNNNGLTTTAGTTTASGSAGAIVTNGGSGGTDGALNGGTYGGGGATNGVGGPGAMRICFTYGGSAPRTFPTTGVTTVPPNQYVVTL